MTESPEREARTQCVSSSTWSESDAAVAREAPLRVSARDFALILELLEDPPPLNAKLKAAIAALPDTL